MARASEDGRDTAVVGMSCRFPGGIEGPAMFWDAIASGRCLAGRIPPERWDAAALAATDASLRDDQKVRMAHGCFVEGLDLFDAGTVMQRHSAVQLPTYPSLQAPSVRFATWTEGTARSPTTRDTARSR